MKVLFVTGSRADAGLLAWPEKVMDEAGFDTPVLNLLGCTVDEAGRRTSSVLKDARPDVVLVLGDRFEIFAAALACHLERVPIAHIGGGDVTEGSYDDAMRDGISRMAAIHFVTSTAALARLTHLGYRNVHLVGNPGIDYIRKADWRRERPLPDPYLLISYQCETIDGTNEINEIVLDLAKDLRTKVYMLPNLDRGNDAIESSLRAHAKGYQDIILKESMPHDEFLNLMAHCDEFIGNSSAMLYEAPELGIKTRMIGKRQRGRTVPWGDGNASQRIVNIFKYMAL